MKRLFSAKSLVVAAVALGAVGLASAAHARSDVSLSIGLSGPIGYGYVQSAPVYVEPQPYYVQPQAYYAQPQAVFYTGGDWRHDDWRREQLRREEMRREEARRHHGWDHNDRADNDHDGVPNRFDRAPNNPYRR
jgi:hypothetical protein